MQEKKILEHNSNESFELEMPLPKNIKLEPKSKVQTSTKSELGEGRDLSSDNSDPEMPLPKNIKTEPKPESNRGNDSSNESSDVEMPRPFSIKIESNLRKKNNYERSSDINKKEESKQQNHQKAREKVNGHGDLSSDSSDVEMPLPKKLKTEPEIGRSSMEKLPLNDDSSARNIPEKVESSSGSFDPEVPLSKKRKVDPQQHEKNVNSPNMLLNDGYDIEVPNQSMEMPVPVLTWKEKLQLKHPEIGTEQKMDVNVTNSDSYALILIPKTVNPQSLLNRKCNFNKQTVIKLNDKNYVFEPMPKEPDPILVNANGPRLLQIQKTIYLREFVPPLTMNEEMNAPVTEYVTLPSEIKVRHPLFGISYKKKLKLDKSINNKLQEAVALKSKAEQKELKKRKKKKEHGGIEETVLDIFNSISTSDTLAPLDSESYPSNYSESKYKGMDSDNGSSKKKRRSKQNTSALESSQDSSLGHHKKHKNNNDVFIKSETISD
ncbi:hypothetical protein ABEB36_010573 [Hypothenemus hampei]